MEGALKYIFIIIVVHVYMYDMMLVWVHMFRGQKIIFRNQYFLLPLVPRDWTQVIRFL